MVSTHTAVRRACAVLIAAALVALLVVVAASPALAHERREVDRFTFVVGWINEPAFSGVPNAVDLRVSETDSEEPVEEGVAESLLVDISFGDEMVTADLRPRFGEPGAYRSDLVPSRPGTWEFRFHGEVDGVEVDETFTSGPETFNDIQDISAAGWPVQDPTTGELAERLERELARLDERVTEAEGMEMGGGSGGEAVEAELASLEDRLASLEAANGETAAAGSDTDSGSSNTPAIVLSIIALALGVVALGATFVRRRA